jgi:tRNA (uracil-5-)-methyltransferase TRM9
MEKNEWDKIAKEWATYRKKPQEHIKEYLKNKKGTILDLGCGSSRNMITQKGILWHGIDASKNMIKEAQQELKNKKIGATLHCTNAWETPYENESFDHIICNAVLHCIKRKKERKQTIKEITRLLKPQGTTIISVWGPKMKVLKNKTKECTINWKGTPRYTYKYEKKELEKEIRQEGLTITTSKEDNNITITARKP